MNNIYWIFILVFCLACNQPNEITQNKPISTTAFANPPEWANEVIWYEISVERFRNGDTSNDPSPVDIKGTCPGFVPDEWAM